MKIIYFDICSIFIFIVILWTCYTRKMTKGHANNLFIFMNWTSLICAIADITMEFVVNPVPLTETQVAFGMLISFIYKLLRNSGMVIYLVYLFSITKTDHILRPLKVRLLLWAPMTILTLALVQNFFTHNVFTVTVETGYSRGPLLILFYAVALIYGAAGTGYAIFCKRYLSTGKWIAILSIYVLTYVSVGIELVKPEYLVEMFATSVGVTMIMLLVMRPEESMDGALGLQNFKSYKTDLSNIIKAHEKAQILVVQITNAQDIRSLLGEEHYNTILQETAHELFEIYKDGGWYINKEVYIERPGTLYYVLDDYSYDLSSQILPFLERAKVKLGQYSGNGVHCRLKVCLIRCPDDLSDLDDIINLGQKFTQLGKLDQKVFLASEIVKSHDFKIMRNIEDILNRALRENGFFMHYQPIYHNQTGRFESAEALLRLYDSTFGMIPPSVFIPVAKANGLILPIGEVVLDEVFGFIAGHDLDALGLSYIEVNLSVSQVLQPDFPDVILRLQKKHRIDPDKVNFEITETMYDNLSEVMDRNIHTLKAMGYGFSLDDYGIGYSNIQRMSKLPLNIIKIDKSLVDEMFTSDGHVIIHNTIRMVQGIHKELVVEGVETKEAIDALAEMSCDYIQGFYYSKPLPQEEFIEFLLEHNQAA